MAALGLRFCTRSFSSCGEQGLLTGACCPGFSLQWLLTAEHGLWVPASAVAACRLSRGGAWA